MPGQPLQPQPPAPYTIRPGQPQDQPQPIYLVAQPPAAAPVYQVPPGAQLVAGPDGRPAYLYPTEQPQVGPTVSPLLVNLALGTVVLLGIGAACWMVAALVTALAALIKALAILALVLVGGTVAVKILSTAGRGTTRIHVQARGRARVNINTRGRGRRR